MIIYYKESKFVKYKCLSDKNPLIYLISTREFILIILNYLSLIKYENYIPILKYSKSLTIHIDFSLFYLTPWHLHRYAIPLNFIAKLVN